MTIFLQITDTLATGTAGSSHDKVLFIDLIAKGGFIMIPITILLIISIYLWIYKFLMIGRNSKLDRRFIDHVRDQLQTGNLQAAHMYAKNNDTAIGRVIENGIATLGRPVKEIESNLESASNIEFMEMERHLGYLGLIAGVAPMLGFIGTIAGVIRIFYNISLSNDISIGAISAGLYEKMITSGFGLIVGIVAYCAYHVMTMKIDRFALSLQKSTFEFIKIINRPAYENQAK